MLKGIDVVMLTSVDGLIERADELEKAHYLRFQAGDVLHPVLDKSTEEELVKLVMSHRSSVRPSKINCIKDIRMRWGWDLRTAKAAMERHWA